MNMSRRNRSRSSLSTQNQRNPNIDLRLESHDFILEFIKCFRENKCLWNYSSKSYKNLELKSQAYNKLLQIHLKYDKNSNLEVVKRKIQSLRGSHRLEVKKLEIHERTNSESGEAYVPKLWYFNELDFLTEQRKVRGRYGSRKPELDDSEEYDSENSEGAVTLSSESSSSLNHTLEAPSSNRKRTADQGVISERSSKLPMATEDEFDLIGRNIACKLRNMTSDQKIFAEKIVNDAVFYGQLKKLQADSHIMITNVSRGMVELPLRSPIQSCINNSRRHESPDQDILKFEEKEISI